MSKPKIRFPQFSDEWKNVLLSEVFTERNEKSVIRPDAPQLSFTIEHGVINPEDKKTNKRDFLMKDKDNKTFLITEYDDIIYNPANIKFGAIHRNKLGRGCVSPIYAVFSTSEVPEFMETVVRNDRFIKRSLKYLEGTVIKLMTLKPRDFLKMDVCIPSKEEQRVIADFFGDLDEVISMSEKEIEKLKEYKQGIIQRLFPKGGKKVPELRFPEFSGDWKLRKFSELYAKSSEKNDGSIGIDKNITVATMQYKTDVTVSSEDYLKTYYTFNVGDIAFEGHHSKEFMFGRFVENDIGDGIVSHIFAVFRPITDYDLQYWKYAIHNEAIMRPVLLKSTKASTMMHDLVTKDFLNESILVPSLEEQRRIGAFLNDLDNLIDEHQRECDKWKEYKKGLLQQMLV